MSRFCKTCGEEIPAGRLKIVPDATQCVKCKEAGGDEPEIVGYYVYDKSKDEKYSKRKEEIMIDDVLSTSIKRIQNMEHGYGWEVMPNPDAPDYGVTIFYYEIEKMNKVGFNDADGDMTFSVAEAKEIGRALIHIAEEIEAAKRRNA